MKINFKSRLAIFLIITALVFSLVACGQGGQESQDASSDTTSDTADNTNDTSSETTEEGDTEVEKPKEIKFMVDGTFIVKENGQDEIIKAYEEMTGIKLSVNQPAHNEYYEKVDLAFATGEIPDVLVLSTDMYVTYAVNGALYDITELYDNSEVKNNITDQAVVDALRLDGKLYGLPVERGNGPITYVRGDWLEKLNIDIPTNYDEFIDMLRRFATEDPDGNGQDDTIPFTAPGLLGYNYVREFYQDARPTFYQKDGKWVDGMMEPEMKEALQRMQDAYKEGLIDKEVITNKTSTCRDKFYSGNVGVFTYWAGLWNQTLQDNLAANVPEGKVTPIPAIEETNYVERVAPPICITAKAENPEGIFKYFLEFMLDAGEGQTLFTHGVEDVMYKMEDGKMVKLPSIQDPDTLFDKIFMSGSLSITNYDDPYEYPEIITSSLELFRSNAIQDTLLPDSEVLARYLPELDAIRSETISAIVMGELSVDEGLDQYVEKAKAYVDEILADINK